MFTKIFKKDEDKQSQEKRLEEKRNRLKNAQPDEKYRKPNPCQGAYPEEDIFNFTVIQEKKQIRLKTYRYKPTKLEQPRAVLIQFHGLNSHSNHGVHLAKAFADEGFVVLAFDHRGFGKSEGIRGFIESIELHLQDSRQFVNLVEAMYGKKLPLFLTGLSMGGMTSYRLSLEDPQRFKGVILMAPAIMNMAKQLLKSLASIFGALTPKWHLLEQKKGIGSKNPLIQEFVDNDPLTYNDKMMPGTGKVIYKGMKEAQKTFKQYNCPFIIVQGGMDKLVDPDVGFELVEQSQTQDKEHLYYDNLWHFVWLEEEIHDIIPKVVNWAVKRI